MEGLGAAVTAVAVSILGWSSDFTGLGGGCGNPSTFTGAGSISWAWVGPTDFFSCTSATGDSYCSPVAAPETALHKKSKLGGSGYSEGETAHSCFVKLGTTIGLLSMRINAGVETSL